MPYSYQTSVASGLSANVTVPFPYIQKTDVHVKLDGVEVTAYTWTSDSTITLATIPAAGVAIRVYRATEADSLRVVFATPEVLDHRDLNNALLQMLYLSQEAYDIGSISGTELASALDFINNALVSVNDGVTLSASYVTAANAAKVAAEAAAATATQAVNFDPSLYLRKDDNLLGVVNKATARTNLELGTMAQATATDYLSKAGNLSGIASTSAARSNLGLGTAAVVDASATPVAGDAILWDTGNKYPAGDGSQITGIVSVLTGTMMMFPTTTQQSGYLKMNGQVVSRASYAALWAWVSANGRIVTDAAWSSDKGAFSSGDGSTTFRLPDTRGYFVRATDDGAGVDTGRTISSLQADSLKDHTHSYNYPNRVFDMAGPANDMSGGNWIPDTYAAAGSTGGASTGAATETRGKNYSVSFQIKY